MPCAPRVRLRGARKGVRIVIVIAQDQFARRGVLGGDEARDRVVDVGVVAGDHQAAIRVVAPAGANGVDESLVQPVDLRVVGRHRRVVVDHHFVHPLEDQVVAVAFEALGDLGPQGLELRQHGVGVGGGDLASAIDQRQPPPGDAVAAVVVDVDDGVHPCVQNVADDLLDALKVRGVDRVAGRGSEATQPGDGDAHGAEARRRDGLNQRARDDRVAPRGFNRGIGLGGVGGVQAVAQVPPQLHLGDRGGGDAHAVPDPPPPPPFPLAPAVPAAPPVAVAPPGPC